MNSNDMLEKAKRIILDNSPAILTAIGVTGTLATAYLTGTATIRAVRIVDEAWEMKRISHGDPKAKDVVRLTWRLYIPAAVTGGLTVGAIIGANRIGSRRAAAVAVAYTLSEKAYAEYREKIKEKLGEKRESAARDEIAQDRVNQNPLGDRQVLLASGKVLCYEAYTGRYFQGDVEDLRAAENTINKQALHHGFASLSDYYDLIGLKHTVTSDDIGWNADKLLEVRYTSVLTDKLEPCLVIDINNGLTRGF